MGRRAGRRGAWRATLPKLAELPMRDDIHDFARLTNLADSIFAVAMTFLAFTIQVPSPGPAPDGTLAARLGAMLPQFGALALSFFIAARLWMLHFRMHRVITR